VFGTPGFPLSDVPLQQNAADAAAGRLDVKPAKIFGFDEIREAQRTMEANEATGKIVVVHQRSAAARSFRDRQAAGGFGFLTSAID
jgi:hypothetical protein